MKKLKYKKILFFILVCICFFLTDKYIVKAATTPYWGYNLEHFNDGFFYDCNSSGCNNSIATGAQWGTDSSGTQYPGFFSGSATTVANSYGIMFVTTFPNQSLFKGYLYSLNTYVCSTGTSYPTLINYYFGGLNDIRSRVYSASFKSKNYYPINGRPYESYGNSSGGGIFEETCGYMSSIFSLGNDFPASSSDGIGIQFTTTSTQSAQYWVVGYSFDNLGYIENLSSSDVQNVINNSGLATATDVQSVNSAVNEVKKDINELNQTQKETNNILKDDNIDSSKTTIEDKSADASKSPISSLLTLPLKLLNNIHTGLSGTCSALNLGSLLGTDLVLPCINLEQRLGSYLWGLIDYGFCIFLIYNVGMLAVKIWTDVIMMRDFFSELYKPQGEKGGKDK